MIGRRLGPYTIRRELGSGGMGTVYLAEDGAGARVAIKVLHPHLMEAPGFFQRFLREAEVGRKVAHENVVRTLQADALTVDSETHHFLVMEYVEGQTLRELLGGLAQFPEALCRHVGREVARALAAIHDAGAVHRDLKPENVLITPDNAIKVMDLGMAQLKDESIRLSQSGAFVGSVLYAAPEQFRGEDSDARTDLYALGLLLHELATGRHAFAAEDTSAVMLKQMEAEPRLIAELNPSVTPLFEELVRTLLRKDRRERPDSARTVLGILEDGENSGWWKSRAPALRARIHRPLRRIRVPRETALYGRETDLTRLRERYAQARTGDGQVVLIEGEAGVGKTRLVDEFAARLQAEGEEFDFLFGAYPPGGAATSAGAFSTAYREHFGAERLEEAAREHLRETPLLAPAFAALLRGDALPGGAEALTRQSLQTVFVHATRSLARARPVVVLIDDLHFAPEEGRAVFASLALGLAGHRVLLIGAHRPGVPGEWLAELDRQPHVTRLDLLRLGPKDLVLLLRESFGSERLARELGTQIAEKSDGNPFFVFEIIRSLRDTGSLRRLADGSWSREGAITGIRIPSTVMDLIRSRVAALRRHEREILDVAACCGVQFDPLLVGAVLEMERIPLLRTLGRIEQEHRLVRFAGVNCLFDHLQVQETLYAGLPELLRREYHGALGEALEARGDATGAAAVELCEHFLRAHRPDDARRHLDPALTHLEQGYLHGQAADLAQRALALEGVAAGRDRARLELRLAGHADFLGLREEQERAVQAARAFALEDSDLALARRAELAHGWSLARARDLDEATAVFERVQEEAVAHGDRAAEAAAAGRIGTVRLLQQRAAEARPWFEKQCEVARAAGDLRSELRATGNLGNVAFAQGGYEEARKHYARCLELARETGDREAEAYAIGNLGTVFWSEGRLREAGRWFERDLELERRIGHREGEAIAAGNLSLVQQVLGRFEEALASAERYLRLLRESGSSDGEAKALGNLGTVLLGQGRVEAARRRFERQLELARDSGLLGDEAQAHRYLGAIHLLLGDLEAAQRELDTSLEQMRAASNRRGESLVLERLGTLAELRGDPAAAERLYHKSLALRRELRYADGECVCLCSLGSLLAEQGRRDEACEHLRAAVGLARELELAVLEVLPACQLAALGEGDPDEAEALLDKVRRRLDSQSRLKAHWLMWKATGRGNHLEACRREARALHDRIPPECRARMLEADPVLREVLDAPA